MSTCRSIGLKRHRQATTSLAVLAMMSCAVVTAPSAMAAERDATIDLNLLVKQHVITKTQAAGLLQLFRKAEAVEGGDHPKVATATVQPTPAPPATPVAALSGPPTPSGSEGYHVQYVPEFVKRQIRDEVTRQVLADRSTKAQPPAEIVPEWIRRIKITGDFRLREQNDLFGSGNFNQLADYNSINNSPAGYDISSNNLGLPPILNTTNDRQRFRTRARLGIEAVPDDNIEIGIRLSTGTLNNPVSPNATLGGNNTTAPGGDFNKFTATFDRAYISYKPTSDVALWGGRFKNPFFTSDLIWYDELALDGFAAQIKHNIGSQLTPYINVGAFPVENTAFDFGYPASTGSQKVPSHDKWLYAAQLGLDWRPLDRVKLGLGAAYWYYHNLQGQASTPCQILVTSDSCNTDLTRPGFVQKGNSLFPIRAFAANPSTTTPAQPEYFGLASQFHMLELREQVDFTAYRDLHLIADGDYTVNLGYNQQRVKALRALNPFETGGDTGNTAYLFKLTFGYPAIVNRWDWNVIAGYKYLESDSVVDAFNDPDFYLGGTNAKGYLVQANLGLAHNVWFNARYYSGTEVSGPPLAIDVLQIDLNARF